MKKLACLILVCMLCAMLWACGAPATTPSTNPTQEINTPTLPATEPVATAPTMIEPVATAPTMAEPVVTDPVITEPVATNPVATEPISTAPAVCNHNYQISENTPATCQQTGLVKYTCANCGQGYQMELPMAAHNFAQETCTEPKTCTVCKRSEGTPLGHNYVIAETVQPTCAADGYTQYACSRCNDSYSTQLPAIPHSFSQATCTQAQTCIVCGQTDGTALGHNYKVTKQVAATCTAKGYKQYTCARCADSYKEELAKTSHNYANATCTQPQTCTVCGATKGKALDHNYVNNICTRCNQIYSNFQIPQGGYDGSHVTITFYHTMGSALQWVLDSYIAEFNKLYPNIHIEHMYVGNYSDLEECISGQLANGSGPNIAYCYPDHVAGYNQLGGVVNLDGLMGSTIQYTNARGETEILGLTPDHLEDFIPGFFEEGRQLGDNLMYSLPMSKSTEVLYYDKTFFEQHNLKVPTTWDEMEALCKKILQIDPNCIPFGYDSESNWFINMCAQSGSDYTSATGSHYLFNNATNRDFAARIRRWYQLGYCTTEETYGGYTSNLFINQYGTRCYMTIGSSGGARYNLPSNYTFEVGVATIPQVNKNEPKVISQGPSLCLFQSKNSQEVIASWLFMKFLTTDLAFQAEFSMTSGYMPVIQSVIDHPVYAQYLSQGDGYTNITARTIRVCLNQMNAYFASPVFAGSSAARENVGKLLVKVMTYSDNGDPAKLISDLFANAVDICIDPTTPEMKKPESHSNKYLLHYLADDLYVTSDEYLFTNNAGVAKIELGLSWYTSDAMVFTIVENRDGTVSFQLLDGAYLYCDGNDVTFSYQQSEYTKFVLEETTGGCLIRCATANYYGKAQYLEVYRGYLTCYSISATSSLDLYIFQLERVN